jgi:thiamine biosynthesis protein ThiC
VGGNWSAGPNLYQSTLDFYNCVVQVNFNKIRTKIMAKSKVLVLTIVVYQYLCFSDNKR